MFRSDIEAQRAAARGPSRRRPIYCSQRCSGRAANNAMRERRRAAKEAPPVRKCERCSAQFQSVQHKARFCSRLCAYRQWNMAKGLRLSDEERTARALVAATRRAAAEQKYAITAVASALKALLYVRTGGREGLRLTNYIAAHRAAGRTASCSDCPAVWCRLPFAKAFQRCPACSAVRAAAARRARKSAEKAVRRARMMIPGETFDPAEVFARDGWRCRCCGVATPQALRGSSHPDAPELDHWVPLAAGGAHSRENGRCMCRTCNGDKAAAHPFDGLTPRALARMGKAAADIPAALRSALADMHCALP